MNWSRIRIVCLCLILSGSVSAQTSWRHVPVDSLKDLTDVLHSLFNKSDEKKDIAERQKNLVQIGVFPAIGYTLQTGFAAVVSANAVFYKKNRKAGDSSLPSTIATSLSYSQKSQTIVPFQAMLFFNNNKLILISDWRYLKYPSYTYGLGMKSSPEDSLLLSYEYLKFHQSALFEIHPHVYVGLGYNLDYFWNVREKYQYTGDSTDFGKYGMGSKSLSSAITVNFLRDTRDNPINAYSGSYLNMIFSPRLKFLGSESYWTSMLLEYRTYIRFPASSNNVLGLWSYNWLTLTGKPPYLMLPSTAWDKTFNTGRGYIQSRFRGNQMLDAEAEYRVQLTRNGLFGMVVFANLESFSDTQNWQFGSPAPAGGLGLRIKLNKFSRTNIAIDYGWGRQGSKGFFVNLGEAF